MTAPIRTTALVLAAALLPLAVAQAPEPQSPESFVQEEGAPTFRLAGDGQLSPADLLELTYQCLGTAAQTNGPNLVVYGFDQIDGRLYRLQGPRALEASLRRAELDAKSQAVEYFNAVVVESRDAVGDLTVDTAQDSVTTTENGDRFSSQLSSQTTSVLASYQGSFVEGSLRGGRMTGTKLISLGDEGMCVGIRYEVPFDQSPNARHGTPTPTPRGSSGAGTSTSTDDPVYEAPPAGSIGDF